MKLNAKKCKEPPVCFVKRSSATPLRIDQQELETVRSHKVLGRGGGRGGVSQEIGAVDLAAICVALLPSVLEYTVAWLDITPFLPIYLVK